MNTFAVLALTVVAMSGAWARPHASHRSHRQAGCDNNFGPHGPSDVVCGNDGKTYFNAKHIEYENCLHGEETAVEREGWCDDDVQAQEVLKDIVWGLVLSFVEGIFKDAELSDVEALVNAIVEIPDEDTSPTEIVNFLKELDENSSESIGDLVALLENLGDSSEDNKEVPAVEEEDNNLESNFIPEIFLD